MPSVAEMMNISLRVLHKSATQHLGREGHDDKTMDRKFQRSASCGTIKDQREKKSFETGDDGRSSAAHTSSTSDNAEETFSEDKETSPYQSISLGFQMKAVYGQQNKMTDIMDVLYNGRTRRFLLLDSRGISSWSPDSDSFKRELYFPKYKTKLLRSVIFCKKYNVYFAICSDFTLKVYNKDFHETCKTENKSMRSILHLIFNPVTDELISAGVAGTIVWKYKQTKRSLFDTIKPMANYELVLHAEYPDIGGTWCTKVEFIQSVQYLFYCSEMDLHAYDARDMRKLFTVNNTHNAALTCVGFSFSNRSLLTGSVDCEVKVWGAAGGHICTLRGHSRAVSSIIIHPEIPGLVFTSSLDGTIKVWSLHTMDLFYSLSVHSEGINWMKLTDDRLIWCANLRKVTLFKFNPIVTFWGHARCRIIKLDVFGQRGKPKRLMAVGEDGSVRLFSQAQTTSLALCTVLPPPVVSLLDNVCDVTYSRFNHIFFLLINPTKLWVYTSKTDPACRIAEWDVLELLQQGFSSGDVSESSRKISSSTSVTIMAMRSFEEKKAKHRCTQILFGKTNPSSCRCVLAVLSENGFQFHTPIGLCSARSRNLLLFGLEDGRIVFADQKRRGLLYCEMQVNKEPIKAMKHKPKQNWLVTQWDNSRHTKFQVWKLPELELQHSVRASLSTTCFAVLDDIIITGQSTGRVIVHPIDDDSSNPPWRNVSEDGPPEHREKVIDVNSCRKRGIFCSSSADGVIKMWNLEKVLLCELRLGGELSSCNFLNDCGDLVIGYKQHLFLIDHKTLLLRDENNQLTENFEKESDIYEDPAMKYDSSLKSRSKPSVITMQKYLVPYGFVASADDEDIVLNENLREEKEVEGSETSEITSCAVTDTYLSPAPSVESFGVIDALFPPKPRDMHRRSNINDFILPEIGSSPGGTPTESVTTFSEDGQPVFDEGFGETEPETTVDEVFEPPWQTKEQPVDLSRKSSTGVMVVKAFRKMKKKKATEAADPEPQKSRFANVQLDSRGLMKAGMTAVFAVEAMKKEKKSNSRLGSGDRLPSEREYVKRTRQSVAPSNQRRTLVPTQVPLDQTQIQNGAQPDGATEPLEDKVIKKLTEMGLKITPQRKVDVVPLRHDQLPRSAVNLQRKKQAIAGNSAKPGLHASNKLKRKFSRSATLACRKSSRKIGQHAKLFTENKLSSSATALEMLINNKLPALEDLKTTKSLPATLGDTPSGQSAAADAVASDNRDSAAVYVQKKQDLDHKIVEGNLEPEADDGSQQTMLKERQQEFSDLKIRDLLGRLGASGDEEKSDDDDDDDVMAIPNLLEYDFQAIYKKDGLQFDDKWKDRMLERYLLMKLQKQQRHEAAMNKRIFLEQERHIQLLAAHPDWAQNYSQPWYEDPDELANYILQSALVRGAPLNTAVPPPNSRLGRRTSSVASNVQRKTPDGHSEKDGKFRLSVRPKSSIGTREENIRDRHSSTQTKSSSLFRSMPSLNSLTTTLKSKSSASMQKLFLERPRSSTSIPGKTRYILVKPEKECRQNKVIVSPTKLEEQLLRKRFPSQHLSVMKSLGRIDEDNLLSDCDGGDSQTLEPSCRAGTPLEDRPIETASSSGRGLLYGIRGGIDKTSFSAQQPPQNDGGWKSSFGGAYINPLDIVKRKPSGNVISIKLPT